MQNPIVAFEYGGGLFEKIPQHIGFDLDTLAQILRFKPQGQTFTALQEQGIETFVSLELVHPEDRPVLAAAWQRALTESTVLDVVIRMDSPANQWRWFQVLANPIVVDGIVTNWVGTSIDIHEKQMMLLELQHSQKQRRLAQEIVLGVTASNQLPEMLDYFTKKFPEVVGNDALKITQLVGPRHLKILSVYGFDSTQIYPGLIWSFQEGTPSCKLLQTQEPVIVENIEELSDDTREWFSKAGIHTAAFFSLVTHYGVFGELCIGFKKNNPRQATDEMALITTLSKMIAQNIERVLLLNELQLLNHNLEYQIVRRTNELRNRTQELEAFVYSASHDLRAPLSMLLAASRRIRENATKNSTLSRIADSVQEATMRMNQMLNVMLELARGEKSEALGLVNTYRLIKQILTSLEAEIVERNVQVEIEFERLEIFFGESELYQVLQNILQNAVKFAGTASQAPWVNLKAIESNQGVWLEISNNTQPLPKTILPRLFDLFYTSDSQHGMGIGLTIVKRIIERYGARVWLECDHEFRVHLWFPKFDLSASKM